MQFKTHLTLMLQIGISPNNYQPSFDNYIGRLVDHFTNMSYNN